MLLALSLLCLGYARPKLPKLYAVGLNSYNRLLLIIWLMFCGLKLFSSNSPDFCS